MRTTNVVCLLLAVAGISFGIGQAAVSAEPAVKSANPNRAVVKQLKKLNRTQFETQLAIVVRVGSIDRRLEALNDSIGTTGNKSVRELIRTICQNTPGFFTC